MFEMKELPKRDADAQKRFDDQTDMAQSLITTMIEPFLERRLTAAEFSDITPLENGIQVTGGSPLRQAIEDIAIKRDKSAKDLIDEIRRRSAELDAGQAN